MTRGRRASLPEAIEQIHVFGVASGNPISTSMASAGTEVRGATTCYVNDRAAFELDLSAPLLCADPMSRSALGYIVHGRVWYERYVGRSVDNEGLGLHDDKLAKRRLEAGLARHGSSRWQGSQSAKTEMDFD